MAFVSRAQRKMDYSQSDNMVGPGNYDISEQKSIKPSKVAAAFGSMQMRYKDINSKGSGNPGPGSYNLIDTQNGQKIVISSDAEDIKILQISRPHPVFKSLTDRFTLIKEEDIQPGPGDYNINKIIGQRPKIMSTNTASNKPKIIQHIMSISKYQSIPSIPSNTHAYGYNENQNNQLQLNEPPDKIYKGEKEDCIGPNHYQVIVKEKIKGKSCWSVSKEKRMKQQKVMQNVGPGSYEIRTDQFVSNQKPQFNLVRKKLRGGDYGTNLMVQQLQKINDKIMQSDKNGQNSQMQSRAFSQKNPPSTMIDDDSEEEYIQDGTPGPGSYFQLSQSNNLNKPSKPVGPSFGVGTKRFVNSTHITSAEIGPGSYQIDIKIKQKNRINPKKQHTKLPPMSIQKNDQPGPGSYQPRNTMEDKLIYKIQRGYRGQFGSTEVRAKDMEESDLPGPGEYDPQPFTQQKQGLSSLKSGTRRSGFDNRNIVPAPGAYNINNCDIASRVIKQQEDDPDLVIKKPGFGVGQPRFKGIPEKQQQFEDDEIIKEIQGRHREARKRKMLKNTSSFKSGQPRIKQKKRDGPGPGAYYDGEEDHWNKRTYNILFADI